MQFVKNCGSTKRELSGLGLSVFKSVSSRAISFTACLMKVNDIGSQQTAYNFKLLFPAVVMDFVLLA